MRAIADAANVHARAEADVFQGRQRLDFAFVVIRLCVFSHNSTAFRMRKSGTDANRK
jgi:hypothetical protein